MFEAGNVLDFVSVSFQRLYLSIFCFLFYRSCPFNFIFQITIFQFISFFLFVWFFFLSFFEAGFHYAALAVLELPVEARLISNSQTASVSAS